MKKHIMFLIGEAEYESQDSMPPFIKEFEKRTGYKTTTCTSTPIEDGVEEHCFAGLKTLEGVDCLVIYTRFRVLCQKQLDMLMGYINSGKPVVGLRTSTHSFKYLAGDKNEHWNVDFGTQLFGTPWRYHHGHESTTKVMAVAGKENDPLLKGVESEFCVRSWLYHVLPLPDTCIPVLMGEAIDSIRKNPDEIMLNPVAYTNTQNGGKVFYTSLGHPEDFEVPSFINLLTNGIVWAAE